jgi:hypothetical protein
MMQIWLHSKVVIPASVVPCAVQPPLQGAWVQLHAFMNCSRQQQQQPQQDCSASALVHYLSPVLQLRWGERPAAVAKLAYL